MYIYIHTYTYACTHTLLSPFSVVQYVRILMADPLELDNCQEPPLEKVDFTSQPPLTAEHSSSRLVKSPPSTLARPLVFSLCRSFLGN